MNHEAPQPALHPAAPAAGINYLKLTLALMAAVLFSHFIEHWSDVKAGFIDGWNGAPYHSHH